MRGLTVTLGGGVEGYTQALAPAVSPGPSVGVNANLRPSRVLGLERFGPAHALGSSHGGSRIIRQSYFEDPAYVPLLKRAYELWTALEADTGADLMALTGGLYLGRPTSRVVVGSLAAARELHSATLLPDGRVLVAGGLAFNGTTLGSAELYDPRSTRWQSPASARSWS